MWSLHVLSFILAIETGWSICLLLNIVWRSLAMAFQLLIIGWVVLHFIEEFLYAVKNQWLCLQIHSYCCLVYCWLSWRYYCDLASSSGSCFSSLPFHFVPPTVKDTAVFCSHAMCTFSSSLSVVYSVSIYQSDLAEMEASKYHWHPEDNMSAPFLKAMASFPNQCGLHYPDYWPHLSLGHAMLSALPPGHRRCYPNRRTASRYHYLSIAFFVPPGYPYYVWSFSPLSNSSSSQSTSQLAPLRFRWNPIPLPWLHPIQKRIP